MSPLRWFSSERTWKDMRNTNPVLLIPAYNPDEQLIGLMEEWHQKKGLEWPVIVINDGSDSAYDELFDCLTETYHCTVLSHEKNQGKGDALKTGFAYIHTHFPLSPGCVTADADGQHSVPDIIQIGEALDVNPSVLYLGTRDFSGSNVPRKSAFGNRISSFFFKCSTGVECADTQTGLRGIPQVFLPAMMSVKGSRYEYEMNMLFWATEENIPLVPIPIETIYIDGNKSSHFHPIRDSIQIYSGFFKFVASSLTSAAVDTILFMLFAMIFSASSTGILLSTISARFGSATVNFLMNKFWVFSASGNTKNQGVRYFILFLVQMGLSAVGTNILATFLPLIAAKWITDLFLFFGGYFVQRALIFGKSSSSKTQEKGQNHVPIFKEAQPLGHTIQHSTSNRNGLRPS